MYLAAFEQGVSAVLVREEAGIQKPIFYVNKVLRDAEVRCMNIEQLAFALLLAVRKFKMYLEGHQGVVMTDQPLKKILHKPGTSRQMLAWPIEISLYCIIYRPRTTIKAQALAEFIAKCSFNSDKKDLDDTLPSSVEEKYGDQQPHEFRWNLFIDVQAWKICS